MAERWPRMLAMPAARRYGHWVRLDQHKLKIARYVFDTMAPRWCPFGRFVSILRTYAAFLAGTSRMRWRKFLVANAAGGILWAGIYTLAAYLAGNALQRASGTIDLVIVAVAIVAIAGVLFFVRRQIAKVGLRAEAAYPRPLEWGPSVSFPPYGRPAQPRWLSRIGGPFTTMSGIPTGLPRAARSVRIPQRVLT